ncbi:hypothetical protein DFP97_104260 [Paenibacillus prosopidis]|uniref:Uncharacterized protein n=1 Tax=Paenibacillus prosopidis TaxID=630520 RepID=A0A368W9Z1_9BACL|nr:hypothetical protein DFP97_104260 [Paenibacillus prosopidis]
MNEITWRFLLLTLSNTRKLVVKFVYHEGGCLYHAIHMT